jgi:ribosome maturation factor RimP
MRLRWTTARVTASGRHHNSTRGEEVGTMFSSSASVGHQLAALLTPVVEATGLDLEDVAVIKQAGRSEVRVLVDKDGGVNLDDVAQVSLEISAALDLPAAGVVLGATPYVLEVSSPGVDRPLVEPRQWRRAAGRLVRVGLTGGGEVTGRIVDADASGVRLAVVAAKPGAPAAVRAFGFDELAPGRVQVEFNRPALDVHNEESG